MRVFLLHHDRMATGKIPADDDEFGAFRSESQRSAGAERNPEIKLFCIQRIQPVAGTGKHGKVGFDTGLFKIIIFSGNHRKRGASPLLIADPQRLGCLRLLRFSAGGKKQSNSGRG